MAGSKSNYLENAWLKHLTKAATFTAPSTWYFALFTAAPSDAGGGTECTGGNYERVAVTVSEANFPVTGNALTNANQILFNLLDGSIGTPVAWGAFDDDEGGNLLYWGDLAAADQKSHTANDQPLIPAGAVSITED